MTKSIFILCICTLYILSSCRVKLTLLEYAFQYKYIATELCENKNRPELNCCGKCYVKKKIASTEATDTPAKTPSGKERLLEVMMHLIVKADIDRNRSSTTFRSLLASNTPPLLLGFDSQPSQPPEAYMS